MKTKQYDTRTVYQRSGDAMTLLFAVAPKMIKDERFHFKGQETLGPQKQNKKLHNIILFPEPVL